MFNPAIAVRRHPDTLPLSRFTPMCLPNPRLIMAGALAFHGLTLNGCKHQTAERPEEPSFLFRGAGTRAMAVTSFGERMPVDVVIPAHPIEPVTLPARPPAAGDSGLRPIIVVVRAAIDAGGQLGDVTPIVESFPPPSALDREFQAAVLAAVARWQFAPAEMRRLVSGSDGAGRSYWMVKGSSPSACALELRFTFEPDGGVSWAYNE